MRWLEVEHSSLINSANLGGQVERLQKTVRDRRAGYAESMAVLEHARRVNPNGVPPPPLPLSPAFIRLSVVDLS